MADNLLEAPYDFSSEPSGELGWLARMKERLAEAARARQDPGYTPSYFHPNVPVSSTTQLDDALLAAQGGNLNFPQTSLPTLTPQQLLDAYLARVHPTAATAAPVVTSDPLNDEYAAARDRLSNIAARFQGVKDPVYKTPNAEADLTARLGALRVPTRTPISGLPEDMKAQALLKMGLSMMGTKSPYFAQGLAEGGTAGLADAEKSQAQILKDAMDKYGIDANQAAALVAARSQDTAGANAIAGQHFKDLHTGLTSEAGIAEKQGALSASQRQTQMLEKYHLDATAQRREAAAAASQDKREREMNADPYLRTLRESALETELAKQPGGQAIIDRLRLAAKMSDAKEQGKMIVDILSKIEDPGKARAALALMKSHTGMSTEQILQIYDAATKLKN